MVSCQPIKVDLISASPLGYYNLAIPLTKIIFRDKSDNEITQNEEDRGTRGSGCELTADKTANGGINLAFWIASGDANQPVMKHHFLFILD
jgi:hypothetical protein